jgi:predicted MFS family arabinose efflux permease
VQFWMLLLAAVTQGTAFGFFGPTRMAFTAELVGREQLGNAITLAGLSMNGTRVFAPSIAGALAGIAIIGIGGTYLIAAVISLGALVQLLRCPHDENHAAKTKARPLAEIADGVRYVMARTHLRRLVFSSFVIIMFGFNYVAFIPALVKGTYDLSDGWVGLMMSASSIGAVLVAVPLATRADGPGVWRLMVFSGIVFGGGVFALGLATQFLVAFAVVAVVGAGTTGYQSLSNTLALNMTDESHHGRVQSLMMLSFAGFGIAAAPLGLLAEWIGLRPAIMFMGLAALLAVVIYAVMEHRLEDEIGRGPSPQSVESAPLDLPK